MGFVPFEEMPNACSRLPMWCTCLFMKAMASSIIGALAVGAHSGIEERVLPEVVGDAALLADPYDPGDVAKKILTDLTDKTIRLNCGRKPPRASFQLGAHGSSYT